MSGIEVHIYVDRLGDVHETFVFLEVCSCGVSDVVRSVLEPPFYS